MPNINYCLPKGLLKYLKKSDSGSVEVAAWIVGDICQMKNRINSFKVRLLQIPYVGFNDLQVFVIWQIIAKPHGIYDSDLMTEFEQGDRERVPHETASSGNDKFTAHYIYIPSILHKKYFSY